jgi:putative addiction module component (TIGR02574 family)
MQLDLEQLKEVAAELSATDRAELAQFLVRSLDEDEAQSIRSDWLNIAERRMGEIKSGKVVAVPADEVLRTLLAPTK